MLGTIIGLLLRLIGLAFLTSGLFIITIGVNARTSFVQIERTGEAVPGLVVDVAPEAQISGGLDNQQLLYAPVIQYESLEGDIRQYKSSTYRSRSKIEIGETRQLLVAPCRTGEDCDVVEDGGFGEFVSKYGILLFGGLFSLFGAWLTLRPPKLN